MVVGASDGKEKKSKTLEKIPKTKKRSKKADTFSGRGTPTSSSLMNSPVRNSSNMYFGTSPSHTYSSSLGASASFSTADHHQQKTPKKASRWSKISNMVNKKLSRGATGTDGDDKHRLSVKPKRSHSIPLIKKSGVYGRSGSVGGEDVGVGGMYEAGSTNSVSSHARRASTSQGNSANLVAKIFSVLGCWVEEFFEVSTIQNL
jgi:hypothetical protein